jgi:hypothetical protein
MSDAMDAAHELKQHARREREQGAHMAAHAYLEQAIERLEASGDPAVTEELADIYGTLGGTLREKGELVAAAAAYDAGYGYEADTNTYNALNRLTTRILLEPASLTDPGALRRYGELEFVDVPQELGALRARLERDLAGPRADDAWAAGDLALTAALTGDADALSFALARFAVLEPPPRARDACGRVAGALAALDTPRRNLLTRLRDELS